FHGRQPELDHIVNILRQDSARIAILGAGGMGKTTVAAAALYHPDVEARYPNRYFVSCQAMTSDVDIISAIASHIGLDKSSTVKRVLQCLKFNFTSLLVLDNFETPWEFPDARKKVEELLAHLADVPNLSILVTMRGAERPGNIQWSHPFLPPLNPLTDSAALETFFDIADDNHDKASVTTLLELTGNLPLAVNLISSAAAYEGCEATLARWETEKTRLLSDGYDQRSSLELSIMLSLSSPRLTPNARELLSLLSVLPDGLSDAELMQCNLPIANILAGKGGLLRTSLALVDRGRLKLLPPIREYIYSSNPPESRLKVPLRDYFYQI
ncbi:P-loop containing nucleoside triphosphate hydrolase protein, partial [Mycena vitilis]